jgi:cold shock CspA family protein
MNLDGTLETIKEGFGFLTARTDSGEYRRLFAPLRDAARWSPGTEVSFTIGENPKGITAMNVRTKVEQL